MTKSRESKSEPKQFKDSKLFELLHGIHQNINKHVADLHQHHKHDAPHVVAIFDLIKQHVDKNMMRIHEIVAAFDHQKYPSKTKMVSLALTIKSIVDAKSDFMADAAKLAGKLLHVKPDHVKKLLDKIQKIPKGLLQQNEKLAKYIMLLNLPQDIVSDISMLPGFNQQEINEAIERFKDKNHTHHSIYAICDLFWPKLSVKEADLLRAELSKLMYQICLRAAAGVAHLPDEFESTINFVDVERVKNINAKFINNELIAMAKIQHIQPDKSQPIKKDEWEEKSLYSIITSTDELNVGEARRAQINKLSIFSGWKNKKANLINSIAKLAMVPRGFLHITQQKHDALTAIFAETQQIFVTCSNLFSEMDRLNHLIDEFHQYNDYASFQKANAEILAKIASLESMISSIEKYKQSMAERAESKDLNIDMQSLSAIEREHLLAILPTIANELRVCLKEPNVDRIDLDILIEGYQNKLMSKLMNLEIISHQEFKPSNLASAVAELDAIVGNHVPVEAAGWLGSTKESYRRMRKSALEPQISALQQYIAREQELLVGQVINDEQENDVVEINIHYDTEPAPVIPLAEENDEDDDLDDLVLPNFIEESATKVAPQPEVEPVVEAKVQPEPGDQTPFQTHLDEVVIPATAEYKDHFVKLIKQLLQGKYKFDECISICDCPAKTYVDQNPRLKSAIEAYVAINKLEAAVRSDQFSAKEKVHNYYFSLAANIAKFKPFQDDATKQFFKKILVVAATTVGLLVGTIVPVLGNFLAARYAYTLAHNRLFGIDDVTKANLQSFTTKVAQHPEAPKLVSDVVISKVRAAG